LDNLTDLVVVTTTSIPALYEAKRAIAALRKMGFVGNRLKVVVNQLFGTQKLSENELEALVGMPVFAKFSAAGQELHDACVQKRLLGKNSDFRVQMASMARKIAGIPEKPRSRVSKIFSFSGKPAIVDGPVSGEGNL
jgi:Flp pilus assembly CpaE family ATPase